MRSIFNNIASAKAGVICKSIWILCISMCFAYLKLSGKSFDELMAQNSVSIIWADRIFILVILLTFAVGMLGIIEILSKLYPPLTPISVPPERITECLIHISSNLSALVAHQEPGASPILSRQVILKCLAYHMLESLEGVSKEQHLLISLYSYDSKRNCLIYDQHFPLMRDGIKSEIIDISDKQFQGYECVKCIIGNSNTATVFNGNRYFKSCERRLEKLKHYIGFRIRHDDRVLGFLNIEIISPSACFMNRDQMQNYLEIQLMPFIILMEYEFVREHISSSNHVWKGSSDE
jgi:hypothetical protein